jgi:hypothetical protein
VPPSRGGASKASEHGVVACHLCGQLETEAHGLPFTDRLGISSEKPFHWIYSEQFTRNDFPDFNFIR